MMKLVWLIMEYAFTPILAVSLPFTLKDLTLFQSNKRKDFFLEIAHDFMFGILFSLLFYTFSLYAHKEIKIVNKVLDDFASICFLISVVLIIMTIMLSMLILKREEGKLTYKDNIRFIISIDLIYFTILVFCVQYGALINGASVFMYAFCNTFCICFTLLIFIFLIRFEINRKQRQIRNGLTNAYFKNVNKEYEEAINNYNEVIKRAAPNNPIKINTYIQLSEAYENIVPPDSKKALEFIEKAIELAYNKKVNQSIDYRISLNIYKARFLKRSNQLDKAKQVWKNLRMHYPKNSYIEKKYKEENIQN